MILYIETSKLNKKHLKIISSKTIKSITSLKRLRNSYTFLGYSTDSGCYRFLGYYDCVNLCHTESAEEFFEIIEQETLLGLLK